MKRLLELICVFGLLFSINLKAMEENTEDAKKAPENTAKQKSVEKDFNWQTAEDNYVEPETATAPVEQTQEEAKTDDDATPATEEVNTESDEDDANNVEEEPFYGPETKPEGWVTKPVPTQVQQEIVQTKWYQKLSAAVKSGALKIQNGYHHVCNGITLVKDKTIDGANYLIKTPQGRFFLALSLCAGVAIVVKIYVPEATQVPGNFIHTDL